MMIVEKKIFELPVFTTANGASIQRVRVGYETYGSLNADRSNAILVTHFFSGTSHAAGKYRESDAAPGYWDYLIGPGKPVDTDRYFVIASDPLCNLNARDPDVVTTGPASINPATGKPYGLSFPQVGIADFVAVQKALVESLGISRLHAVMGPSMGGLQAYEWAASHPDMVGRLIAVISAAEANPWLVAWLDVWASPIRLDPLWHNGDYAPDAPPLAGLTQALKVVGLQANHWLWAEQTQGREFAIAGADPARDMGARYRIEATLEAAAAARAALSDANHFLYLVKANQTFVAGGPGGVDRIRVPTLILYAPTDQVFAADWIRATAERIRSNGVDVETAEIAGILGHLDGVMSLSPHGGRIRAFLARG